MMFIIMLEVDIFNKAGAKMHSLNIFHILERFNFKSAYVGYARIFCLAQSGVSLVQSTCRIECSHKIIIL